MVGKLKTLRDYIEDVQIKENMANIYNEQGDIKKNQNVYDAFNDFIFSTDRNVFNKLIARASIYYATKKLHGDIIECGVYKGSGMLTWLKLMDVSEYHSIKKVVGFDMFNPAETLKTIFDEKDHGMMKQVFDRDSKNDDLSLDAVHNRIIRAGFRGDKYELVKGDITKLAHHYVKEHPGLRISILYLDLDIADPTYSALEAFESRIVKGGCIVFDEYAYQAWSESDAADDFIAEHGSKYEIVKLDIKAPTLLLIKK